MTFQPLQLVAEYGVQVETIDEADNPDLAWVRKNDEEQKEEIGYTITLNSAAIKNHYEQSWVNEHITLQYYTLGFLMHEISHIRYKTFTGTAPFDDGLFHHITNVVEDSRIEYALWYEFPSHAKPLRWTLASVMPVLDEIRGAKEETKTRIAQLLGTLWRVSRFGVLDDELDDAEFVSFFLPLTLSATVNDRQNLLDACGLIYLWILESCSDDPQVRDGLKALKSSKQGLGNEQLEKILGGEQIADSGVHDLAEQETGNDSEQSKQKDAGHKEQELVIEDKTNAFCRQVIARRAQEIRDMHTTFRLTRQGWDEAPSNDDSGSIVHLVDAYVNSFSFDEGYNFSEPRRVVPALTMWMLRDVSTSTSDVMEEYAEACVMLHAALVGIPKVRSGQIDFSDDATMIKHVDEELSESKLYPYVDGGTYISSSFELLMNEDFGTDQKVLCIITDGQFWDSDSAEGTLDTLVEEKNIDEVFTIYIGSEHDLSGEQTILGRPAYYCSVEEIPEVIYATVIRLRDGR